MSSKTTIPITSVAPGLADAKRMAVQEIERFLGRYCQCSDELLARTKVASVIAGHWFSRVPHFHQDDDFLHLTRDVLLYFQSGNARSQASDQLAYFFSGLCPATAWRALS